MPAADFIARVGETALDFLVEPIFDFIEEKLVSFENHLVAEFDFVEGRFVKDGAFDIVQFEATVVDDDLSDLLAFLLRKRGIIIRGDPVELLPASFGAGLEIRLGFLIDGSHDTGRPVVVIGYDLIEQLIGRVSVRLFPGLRHIGALIQSVSGVIEESLGG